HREPGARDLPDLRAQREHSLPAVEAGGLRHEVEGEHGDGGGDDLDLRERTAVDLVGERVGREHDEGIGDSTEDADAARFDRASLTVHERSPLRITCSSYVSYLQDSPRLGGVWVGCHHPRNRGEGMRALVTGGAGFI